MARNAAGPFPAPGRALVEASGRPVRTCRGAARVVGRMDGVSPVRLHEERRERCPEVVESAWRHGPYAPCAKAQIEFLASGDPKRRIRLCRAKSSLGATSCGRRSEVRILSGALGRDVAAGGRRVGTGGNELTPPAAWVGGCPPTTRRRCVVPLSNLWLYHRDAVSPWSATLLERGAHSGAACGSPGRYPPRGTLLGALRRRMSAPGARDSTASPSFNPTPRRAPCHA
jgi:hypothetical protein